MEKIDVLHIYHGTGGSNGLYLDEIYNSLKFNSVRQDVIANYYYPFSYAHRVFFKYTDLQSGMKKSFFRLFLRGVELTVGLIYSLFFILKTRPKVVNYSIISTYLVEVWFLKLVVKLFKVKLVLTLHDVVPFDCYRTSIAYNMEQRFKLFNSADVLLVHTENSCEELKKYFNVDSSKILLHPFPIMDLNKLSLKPYPIANSYDFVFLGHLRKEKGVELLLEAWKIFSARFPKATLLIAGNKPHNVMIQTDNCENITFRLEFLSDREYLTYLSCSKYLILPYTMGTNSGVVFTAFSQNISIITSSIPMFSENPLVNKELIFEAGSVQSLVAIMTKAYLEKIPNNYTIEQYRAFFDNEVYNTYKHILA